MSLSTGLALAMALATNLEGSRLLARCASGDLTVDVYSPPRLPRDGAAITALVSRASVHSTLVEGTLREGPAGRGVDFPPFWGVPAMSGADCHWEAPPAPREARGDIVLLDMCFYFLANSVNMQTDTLAQAILDRDAIPFKGHLLCELADNPLPGSPCKTFRIQEKIIPVDPALKTCSLGL
jgi:hypothetical protein